MSFVFSYRQALRFGKMWAGIVWRPCISRLTVPLTFPGGMIRRACRAPKADRSTLHRPFQSDGLKVQARPQREKPDRTPAQAKAHEDYCQGVVHECSLLFHIHCRACLCHWSGSGIPVSGRSGRLGPNRRPVAAGRSEAENHYFLKKALLGGGAFLSHRPGSGILAWAGAEPPSGGRWTAGDRKS